MQKAAVILLLILCGFNNLVQSSGFTQSFSLYEMYAQCSEEDPDITPLDFVVEHLLNLEDAMQYFEGEDEADEGERPHVPYPFVQSSVQIVVALPGPIQPVLHAPKEYPGEKAVYPLRKEELYLNNFYADIFRPPIV